MSKLLTAAAALALAVSTVPSLVSQAQAAPPAKSPYCNLAPAGVSASWAEYYGCWGGPPRTQYQPTPAAYTGPGPTDFCKLPPSASSASWNEHYGCWRPHH